MKNKIIVLSVLGVFLFLCLFGFVYLKSKKVVAVPVAVAPVVDSVSQVTFISVDFDKIPLSDVVQFVSSRSKVKILFDGLGTSPITWQEFDFNQDDLLRSFIRVVVASGFEYAFLDGAVVISLISSNTTKYQKLDFMLTDKGLYFLFDDKVLEASKMPCSLSFRNGDWFAILSFPSVSSGSKNVASATVPVLSSIQPPSPRLPLL